MDCSVQIVSVLPALPSAPRALPTPEHRAAIGDMALVVVMSLHASPGVTTLATGLAHHLAIVGRPAMLVEADPDGGVLAARHDLPLAPSLTDLAGAARRSITADDLDRYSQRLGQSLPTIVAHPSAEQTSAALRASAGTLATAFASSGLEVTVDVGRWRADSPARPIVDLATAVVLVARPVLEDVVQIVQFATTFPGRERVRLVLAGDRPFTAVQIAEATGFAVAASIPGSDSGVVRRDRSGGRRQRHAWRRALEAVTESLGAFPEQETGETTY